MTDLMQKALDGCAHAAGLLSESGKHKDSARLMAAVKILRDGIEARDAAIAGAKAAANDLWEELGRSAS